MSETSPRRILHLVVEGFPKERESELAADGVEIFHLTESNAREVLEKIFAADSIAVWGKTV
jgi:hypothetical protein